MNEAESAYLHTGIIGTNKNDKYLIWKVQEEAWKR